jgi:hypothetical protein
MRWRLALSSLLVTAPLACGWLIGDKSLDVVAPDAGEGGSIDAAAADSGNPADAQSDQGSPWEISDALDDQDFPVEAGEASCPFRAALGGSEWAQWPVPNAEVDGGPGLPNAMSYHDNGDGTVTDEVTHLMWQGAPPVGSYAQDGAASYCSVLALAGHCDWRLPTEVELLTLADHETSTPAIDVDAFPATPQSVTLWSSSPRVGAAPPAGRYVYFMGGSPYYADPSTLLDVLCVRGQPPNDAGALVPPARYQVTSSVVRDVATGLSWQAGFAPSALTYADARSYCANLNLASLTWRLPTMKELWTLIDVAQLAPTIDLKVFPATPADHFWASPLIYGVPGKAWAVNFDDGSTTGLDVTSTQYVRCVH